MWVGISMIRCEICGRITEDKETTCLKEIKQEWVDDKNRKRVDIVSVEKVCYDCYVG